MCLKDTYSLISYVRHLEANKQVSRTSFLKDSNICTSKSVKAFELIEKARGEVLYDSLVIRKYYIILAIALKKEISVTACLWFLFSLDIIFYSSQRLLKY